MAGSKRRYRFLLVTNWISWAGAETQTAHLAIGLSAAGHDVTLLAIGSVYVDTSRIEAAGVRIVALGTRGRPAKLLLPFRIGRMARRADLVFCAGWDATLWGRLGALLARRPAVVTEHTPGREYQVSSRGASRKGVISLHNRLLDRATSATVVVGGWQRSLLEAEGVRGESIVHIPNAVPVDELRQEAAAGPRREELGLPVDALVIIEVARFAPQKGQSMLLSAASSLRDRLGDVRVLFVGDGDTEPQVRREAEQRGADWAQFLGHRHDVPALLRMADIAVLPSLGEGLPMSLIEAIAVGTPVIGTDVGDVRWLIEATGAGLCVPPGNEEAFREACSSLLSDSALRDRLTAAAGEGIGRFDAPLMISRYEQVFEAVIESKPLPQL